MDKPLVLVVGGTGRTAQCIYDALLGSGTFRIAALVRPASRATPAIETLGSKGIAIRVADVAQDSVETLEGCLAGVDILISAVSFMVIAQQKNVMEAAKKAGVGRVIPCDFGTACPLGRRALHDEKLAICAFIRDLGVPYTFIDVGWWMELVLPHPTNSPAPAPIAARSRECFGTGTVKTAVTSFKDIGRFMVRIIADPRTLNQYVFCWGEEMTLKEVYPLADRVSGEKLSDLVVEVSAEEVLKRAAEAKARWKEKPIEQNYGVWCYFEYIYSIYFCGDNTLEKAKAAGALDARELYPDYKPDTLEECARQFYTKIPWYITG